MSIKPLTITDMRQWNTVRPKKRKKNDENLNSSSEIELSNSFEALSEKTNDSTTNGLNMDEVDEDEKVKIPSKKEKIPPLVIYSHIDDHTKTLNEIQKDLKEKLTINCKRNRMIIYAGSIEDYRVMRQKIEAAKLSYHTYSLDADKPVVSILKGLPDNVTTLEIKDELEKDYKLPVMEVKQFIKKSIQNGVNKELKLPIFCVKFGNSIKITEVKKVRVLCYCKVSWEKNFSSNSATQCYKCQSFGHIAKNCFRPEFCATCAGNHNTLSCEGNKVHKCVNCGGDHRANDDRCPARARATSRKNSSNRFSYNNSSQNGTKRSPSTNTADSYAERVRRGREYNRSDSNVNKNSNGNNNKTYAGNNDEFSLGSLFSEIKSIFSGLDLQKMFFIAKDTLSKIKNCSDPMSKFSCLVEGIINYFD